MVRTFFIIFMVMEKRIEILKQLHEQMLNQEMGHGTGVYLQAYDIARDQFILKLIVPVTAVDVDMFQNAMAAYYETVKDYVENETYRLQSIIFTGGLKDVDYGLDILDPQLNLMPAYVRHAFVLPEQFIRIPDQISKDVYVLNEAVTHHLKNFISAVGPQAAVLKRAQLHVRKLSHGRFEVEMHQGEFKMVHFTLPPDSTVSIEVSPRDSYKLVPALKTDNMQVKLWLDDQDAESFLALDVDGRQRFVSAIIHKFVELFKKYGIKVDHSDSTEIYNNTIIKDLVKRG